MKANIKIFITALVLLIFVGNIYAQKGIRTNNPEPSSVLDLTSTTKGLLIPRMTTLQRTNLPSPAEGLQVYDTDTHTHWFYNGSIWKESYLWSKSGTNISPAILGDDLLLNTGETLSITDMTQGSVPFIGTSGLITQNNSQLFWDATNNRLGLGTDSPTAKLQVNGTIAPETTGQDLGTSTLKWDAHLNDVDAVTVTTNEMTINDLLIAPKLASAPATPTAGQIYYDTTTNKLRCFD